MKIRRIFGWCLFILAPIFGLAELGFWAIAPAAFSQDPPDKGYGDWVVIVIVSSLVIIVIAMLGGWYLAHPTQGEKIRKPLGWVMLFLGFVGIPLFVKLLYENADSFDFIFQREPDTGKRY